MRPRFAVAAGLLLLAHAAAALEITLPEPFAVELPSATRLEIERHDPALTALLAGVVAEGKLVTHDMPATLPVGVSPITFTAWSGAPGTSTVAARRRTLIMVLPLGQSPMGTTDDERSTASNNQPRVVRDSLGAVHVAWLESRNGVARVMHRRGQGPMADGRMRWDGPARALSEPGNAAWNSFVGLATIPGGVLAFWQAPGGIVFRRIAVSAAGAVLEPAFSTGLASEGRIVGPQLGFLGGEMAMLTPEGVLARSGDGGRSWRRETMPVPAGRALRQPVMAIDRRGNLHVVFTGIVEEKRFWELRYVRRDADGRWVDAHDVLADLPAWRRPSGAGDVVADFATLRVDADDNLHVAWHGTAGSLKFGEDETFYRMRAARSDGWAAWSEPRALWLREPGRVLSAFSPVIALDPPTRSAIATVFFINGREFWETGARLLRGGALVGDRQPISQLNAGRTAMQTDNWFPSVPPVVHRPDARSAWLDVVMTSKLQPEDGVNQPHVIVHQAADVSRLLAR